MLVYPAVATALEKPVYEVVEEYAEFELRRYAPYWVAEVGISAPFEEAGNRAFRILANYIGGANTAQRKIAMTAPVEQQLSGTDTKLYYVRFFIPSPESTAPPDPRNSQITLRKMPGGVMAALRYSGDWGEQRYSERETRLFEAVRKAGLVPDGTPPIFARYNPPFWPWFLRRNEILLPVDDTMSLQGGT